VVFLILFDILYQKLTWSLWWNATCWWKNFL